MVHRYVMSTDTRALWMGRKDFIFYFSLVCKNLTDSAAKSCFTIPDAPEQDARESRVVFFFSYGFHEP